MTCSKPVKVSPRMIRGINYRQTQGNKKEARYYYRKNSNPIGVKTVEDRGQDTARWDNFAAQGPAGVSCLQDQEARVLGRTVPLLRGPAESRLQVGFCFLYFRNLNGIFVCKILNWKLYECFLSPCRDTIDGPACGPCPPGYKGDGRFCERDACGDDPCFEGVQCYPTLEFPYYR